MGQRLLVLLPHHLRRVRDRGRILGSQEHSLLRDSGRFDDPRAGPSNPGPVQGLGYPRPTLALQAGSKERKEIPRMERHH